VRREEALGLIDEFLGSDERGFTHRLLDADDEPTIAGMAVAVGPSAQSYQVLVLVEEVTGMARELFNEVFDRADQQAVLRTTGPIGLDSLAPASAGTVRPLRPGCSVGSSHAQCTGTLGSIVTAPDGSPAVLSNAHVLTPAVDGETGGLVCQPGLDDATRDDIATVIAAGAVQRRTRSPIDAAAAAIHDGVDFDTQLLDGTVVSPEPLDLDEDTLNGGTQRSVFKVGRTTGTTRGTITAIEGRLRVPYHGRKIWLDNLVFIEGASGGDFTRRGDSGSVVYSAAHHRPISLHVGSTGTGYSFGHPYRQVLEALNVTPWDR
jgi:hypothetical protein